jgi:hypothetical protein
MITISVTGSEAITAAATAAPEKVARAQRRAITTIVRWVKKQGSSEIASAAGTTQSLLKNRFATRSKEGIAWVGLNDLEVSKRRFRTLRQTQEGVTAGNRTVKRAFVAKMESGHIAAFKRRRKTRLPIDVQTFNISPLGQAIISNLAARTEARLTTELARQINYALNVEGTAK